MGIGFTSDDAAADTVGTGAIENGAVTTAKLATGAVTTDRLADGAVTAAKLALGAITSDQLGTDSVGADEIVAGAVGTTELANLAVTEGKIAANAVTSGKIAADAVGSSHIANGSVGADEIATGAVGTDELATDAVTNAKLADNAVDTGQIVDGCITAAKFASGAVGTASVTDNSITTAKLVDLNVTTAKLADNNVTAAKLTAALRDVLGIDNAQSKRRGSKTIATSETVTSTTYTALATADVVSDIVLPTAGILRIGYQALIKLTANLTAAIFINGVQLKAAQNNGAPAVVEHTNATSTYFTPLATSQADATRMMSGSSTASDSSNVGTGQVLGRSTAEGGFIEVFADAGTYDIEVRFKVGSGTGTIKERKLWVEAIGFPAE